MTGLALDRPVMATLASSVFDAVLAAPQRVAHARRMQEEANHILSLSTKELEEMQTTREELLRALAQKV